MARHEGDLFKGLAEGEVKPLPLEEVLELLGRPAPSQNAETREAARACYLSSSDGWEQAVRKLGGAFSADIPALTVSKGE